MLALRACNAILEYHLIMIAFLLFQTERMLERNNVNGLRTVFNCLSSQQQDHYKNLIEHNKIWYSEKDGKRNIEF